MLPALPCGRSPVRRRCRGEPPWRAGAGLRRRLFAAALLVATAASGGQASAAQPLLHLRCTNPASGTSWQLIVDLDRQRVGSLPATISDKWIRWHDPKEGFYDLQRATGRLQLRNASSTGGYFLYYSCQATPN